MLLLIIYVYHIFKGSSFHQTDKLMHNSFVSIHKKTQQTSSSYLSEHISELQVVLEEPS